MSVIDHIIEIVGAAFFLIIGIWATAYSYGFVSERIVRGFCWRPEFQRPLRWLGPLLVVACLGSTVFLIRAVVTESSPVIESFGGTKRVHPTSATLKQCPDDHSTLKDVPIVYGTPPFDGPAAKRWQERIEKFEMWSGGCVGDSDSPTVRPTCTTCAFGFESESGHWSRASADITTFTRSFSDLIISFPKPNTAHLKDGLRYYQSVSTNRVVHQSVSFTTSEPRDALVSRINDWFKTNSIKPTYSEKVHTVTFDGSQKLISDWQAAGASVMLHHTKNDGNSWVMSHISSR